MSTNTQTDAAVNPNKALWEKGDFTRIASAMRQSGEALVAGLEITPGMDVLDLGCGDGTTAFWTLVEERRPHWREQRAWLREHGPELLALKASA